MSIKITNVIYVNLQIPMSVQLSMVQLLEIIHEYCKRNQYSTKVPSTRMRIFLKTEVFFLRFGVASTRKRRFRHAKTEVFENALQSGGFRKRRFRVYLWTGENEGFRKR